MVPLPGIQTGPYFDSECVSTLRKGGFSVVSLTNIFWLFDDFYNAVRRFADLDDAFDKLGENVAMRSVLKPRLNPLPRAPTIGEMQFAATHGFRIPDSNLGFSLRVDFSG